MSAVVFVFGQYITALFPDLQQLHPIFVYSNAIFLKMASGLNVDVALWQ